MLSNLLKSGDPNMHPENFYNYDLWSRIPTNLQVHLTNSKYSRFPRIQILNFGFVGSKSLWFILWAILIYSPNSLDYLLKPKHFSPTLSIAVHLQLLLTEYAPYFSSNHYSLPNDYTKLGPLIKTKVFWFVPGTRPVIHSYPNILWPCAKFQLKYFMVMNSNYTKAKLFELVH